MVAMEEELRTRVAFGAGDSPEEMLVVLPGSLIDMHALPVH